MPVIKFMCRKFPSKYVKNADSKEGEPLGFALFRELGKGFQANMRISLWLIVFDQSYDDIVQGFDRVVADDRL